MGMSLEQRSDQLVEAIARLEMAAEEAQKPPVSVHDRLVKRQSLAAAAIKYSNVLRRLVRGGNAP